MPWIAGVAAVLLSVGFAFFTIGVVWLQGQQMSTLLTKIEASEAAMGRLQDNVAKSYAEHGDDEAALNASLKKDAEDGIVAIGAASHDILEYKPIPLDQNMIDAQAAYLRHTSAWLAYLNKAAADPSEFSKDQPDVDSTFRAFEPKLRAAIPPIPMDDIQARVDAIFKNGYPPADSSNTQSVLLLTSSGG